VDGQQPAFADAFLQCTCWWIQLVDEWKWYDRVEETDEIVMEEAFMKQGCLARPTTKVRFRRYDVNRTRRSMLSHRRGQHDGVFEGKQV
jgi:hypothetical protein